jgi:hypothetical protein
MNLQADPEHILSEVRVLTMNAIRFFYVTHEPVPWGDLDKILDPLIDSLYEAKAKANLGETGPDIFRYYRAEPSAGAVGSDLWIMEVGIPVKPEIRPSGEAMIKTLPPYRCVGMLLWGSLAHVQELHSTVSTATEELGETRIDEAREWTYYFESPDSPHNLMGLYVGIE